MTDDARDPEPSAPKAKDPLDSVSLDEAFLDIPDEENEAILDARKTTIVTVVSVVAFIAVVLLFIL